MEKTIYVETKSSLIKTLFELKKGVDCITKVYIDLNDIGLIEDKDLLFKVLSYANGLCKIYYKHQVIFDCTDWKEIFKHWSQDTTVYSPQFNNSLSVNVNNNIYNIPYIYQESTLNSKTNTIQYYISPIIEMSRFNSMFANRISILEKIEDFKHVPYDKNEIANYVNYLNQIGRFTLEDLAVLSDKSRMKKKQRMLNTSDIYVLKLKNIDAINVLSDILKSQLHEDIEDYIFLFKCGKIWYTLSQYRYVNVKYHNNDMLDINGTFYIINRR